MSDVALETDETFEQFAVAPGEWYVIHSYAGHERQVKRNLEIAVRNRDLEGFVHRIEVPMESVWEVRNGERRKIERVKLPGYILVRMNIEEPMVWSVIRATSGVTGFVGHAGSPVALSAEEAFRMLVTADTAEIEEAEDALVTESGFFVGDSVRVKSGPFETLAATVTDINTVAQRVTVVVELFGRDTPVELNYNQIESF